MVEGNPVVNRTVIRGLAVSAAAASLGVAGITAGTSSFDRSAAQARMMTDLDAGVPTSAYVPEVDLDDEKRAVRAARKKAALEARAKAAAAAKAKAVAEARRKARAAAAARASRARARAALFSGSPKAIARAMVAARGWGSGQFSCLESLWERESGWNYRASNPSSGAYGIPQALPGGKMASAGSDWRTNPATQIRWGLSYIAERYGTPCGAWGHSQASGWY